MTMMSFCEEAYYWINKMNDVGWRFAQNTSTTEMPQNHITVLPQNLPLSIVIYISSSTTTIKQTNDKGTKEGSERRRKGGTQQEAVVNAN